MALKDEFTFPIKCPKCGKKLEKSLARLERDKKFTCTCGAVVELSGNEIATMNRELDKLDKAFRAFGGKKR